MNSQVAEETNELICQISTLRSQEIKTFLQNVSLPYQSESLLCSLPISLGSGSAQEGRAHRHHVHCFRSAALYPVRVHTQRLDPLCVMLPLHTSTMNLKKSNLDNRTVSLSYRKIPHHGSFSGAHMRVRSHSLVLWGRVKCTQHQGTVMVGGSDYPSR